MGDIEAVRADLAARITVMDGRAARARPGDLVPDLDAIRLIAHRAGLDSAVTVAHFLGSALARGERGPLVHDGLVMLADAVRCERQDLVACEAYAAACSVRLAA